MLAALLALLLSACDWWPRGLEPLAESIGQELSGDTEAWLVGGDIAVINVAGSPAFEQPESELEALAMELAEQTIEFVESPLEAVTVTFYRNAMTDEGDDRTEFIFVVEDGQLVHTQLVDPDATGPLTDAELEASIDSFEAAYDGPDDTWTLDQRDCVLREAKLRAAAAGDPESLDPATVSSLESVSALTWNALDDFGRRLLLVQVITTEALFACISESN